MERRLLSVIIPMYNAEKFIASMIKAIQNQSYTNFEVIIVDDQSTDKSEVGGESFRLGIGKRFAFWVENGGRGNNGKAGRV